MKIDRNRALGVFQEYVEGYDRSDEKVRLKVEHTYRVSSLCKQIASSLILSKEDVDLAWLLGLLHDIGRFEQLKNYGTFIDAESIDHAQYGAEILFGPRIGQGMDKGPISDIGQSTDNELISDKGSRMGKGNIRDFIESPQEDRLIQTAIACHSSFRIPDHMEERTRLFCHILRDADKIDILKVNVDFPLEEIYNVTTRELRNGQVTQAVLVSFEEERAVLKNLKQTAVDHVVGHISLVYELVYPVSLSIVKKQGYLHKLMNFESEDPVTQAQFQRIREKMGNYIEKKGHLAKLHEK